MCLPTKTQLLKQLVMGWIIRFHFPSESQIFLLATTSRVALGLTKLFLSVLTRALQGKSHHNVRLDYLPPSSVKYLSFISKPSVCLHSVVPRPSTLNVKVFLSYYSGQHICVLEYHLMDRIDVTISVCFCSCVSFCTILVQFMW